MLGYIAGVLTVLAMLAVEAFLRPQGKTLTRYVSEPLKRKGRPKGAIYEPESDLEYAKGQIIAQNDADGIDTYLEDLQ